jgi:hypothetical protein
VTRSSSAPSDLSDVVFGAAVGDIAGRTVTRHGPRNFALMPMVVPGGAGLFFVRLHAATAEVAPGH